MAQLAALASSVAVVRKELDKLDEAIKQQVLSASALRKQLAAGAQQQLQLQSRACSLRSQLHESEEECSDLSSWAEVLEQQLSAQRAAAHTSQKDVTSQRKALLKLVEEFEAASSAFEQQQGLPALQQQLDDLAVEEGRVKDGIRSEYKQVQGSIAANQELRAEHAAAQQRLADLQQTLEERKQQLADAMAQGTSLLEQLQRLQTHAPAAAQLAEADKEVADLEDELVQVHCMLAVQEVEASRAQATVQQLHELVAGKKRRLNDLSNGIKAMGTNRSRAAPPPAASAANYYAASNQGHAVPAYGYYPCPAYPPAAAAGTAAPLQAAAVSAPAASRLPTVIVQEPDSEGEGVHPPPGTAAATAAASGPNPYQTSAGAGAQTCLQVQPAPQAAASAAVAGGGRGRMAVQETVVCHMFAGRDGAPSAVLQQKIKVTEVTQQLRSASGSSYQPSRQVMVEHEQRIQGMPPPGSRSLKAPHQALLGPWPHNNSTNSSSYPRRAAPALLGGAGSSAGVGACSHPAQPWPHGAQPAAAAAGGGHGIISGAGAAGSMPSSGPYPGRMSPASNRPPELFTTAGVLLQRGQDRQQQQPTPPGPPLHGSSSSCATGGGYTPAGAGLHPHWSSRTAASAYTGPPGSSTAGYNRTDGPHRQQQQQGWGAPAPQQQANTYGNWIPPTDTYTHQQQGPAAAGQGAAAAMYSLVAGRRASGGGAAAGSHHQQQQQATTIAGMPSGERQQPAPAWQVQGGGEAGTHPHAAAGTAPGADAGVAAAHGHPKHFLPYNHQQHQPQPQPQQQQQQQAPQQRARSKPGSSAGGGKQAGGTKQRRLRPPPAEVDTLQHDQGQDAGSAMGPAGGAMPGVVAGRKKARAPGKEAVAGPAGGSAGAARGGRGGGRLLQEEDNPFA